MTETEVEAAPFGTLSEQGEHCPCQSFLRATERAALGAARWLGRDDQEAAEESAATGMRATLDLLPISGRVIFGSLDDSGGLTPGATIGGSSSTSPSTRSRAAASWREAATGRCR